ncbi:SOS response-associated peptidase [Amycolatopsis sp. NPDC024027]|uniref:SOS response-associated peptidase n=1 Tax=Amycolatopsis sp. NPDC024027 TaxID=3154327 RepID=UPI0033E23808
MCGRYASSTSDRDIAAAFGVAEIDGGELPPSWNIVPTQQARIVLERSPRSDPAGEPVRLLRTLTWRLVPPWAKEVKLGKLINARSETVTEKPAFKVDASRRCCLVPADGYYEWERRDDGKVRISCTPTPTSFGSTAEAAPSRVATSARFIRAPLRRAVRR